MKIKYILIIFLGFMKTQESLADYKPIYSHFGYPTQTFIAPIFASIPANNFKNDFSLNTATLLNQEKTKGILLSADVYNRSFSPETYRTIGIIPTKTFVENRLALCFLRKIDNDEYFYFGPSVRTIDISTGSYIKPNYEFVNPVSRGYHNIGFVFGYNRIWYEKIALVTNIGILNSKHIPLMYSIDLNYVPIDNLCLSLGSADTDIHGGVSLINGWGRVGYRANFINEKIFHSVFAGLSLNY